MHHKLLTILIFIIVFNAGCQEDNRINGHWHIFTTDGFPYEFSTLDINDSTSTWEQLRYEDWTKSIIDKENKVITLPFIEIYAAYQYHLRNDTLVLEAKDSKNTLFGIRQQKECSLEADYFSGFIIEINLPIIDSSFSIKKEIDAVCLELLIGIPNKYKRNSFGDSVRLESQYRIITLEELEVTNRLHLEKLPERSKDKISTIIYADKHIMMSKLIELIKKQRSINNRDIYLVGKQKEDSKIISDLNYMLIEKEVSFNKEDNLESWIKKKYKNHDIQIF